MGSQKLQSAFRTILHFFKTYRNLIRHFRKDMRPLRAQIGFCELVRRRIWSHSSFSSCLRNTCSWQPNSGRERWLPFSSVAATTTGNDGRFTFLGNWLSSPKIMGRTRWEYAYYYVEKAAAASWFKWDFITFRMSPLCVACEIPFQEKKKKGKKGFLYYVYYTTLVCHSLKKLSK